MRAYVEKINDSYMVYLPDSLRFFRANKETVDVINGILDNKSFSIIKENFPNLSLDTYNKLLSELSNGIEKSDQLEVPLDILPRLVINISNSCNLGCRYCYANGGVYSSKDSLMSMDILEKTLDTFYNIYRGIGTIQLFGGEPTLNLAAIKYLCEYIKTRNHQTGIGIVTNGTIMTDELINMIKDYKIYVTVSLDHYSIHNKLRPFKNQNGSYDIIIKNLKKLKVITGQPNQVEVTYTKLHEKLDISISDIILKLKDEVGVMSVHVAPVCTDISTYRLDDINSFLQSVDEYFNKLHTSEEFRYSYVDRFLHPLRDKEPNHHFCSAGYGTLSVASDGTLYPCFFFIDKSEYKIGNVMEDTNILKDKLYEINKRYQFFDRNILEKCKDCFANTVCFGCLGVNEYYTGDCNESTDFQCLIVKKGLLKILRHKLITTQA